MQSLARMHPSVGTLSLLSLLSERTIAAAVAAAELYILMDDGDGARDWCGGRCRSLVAERVLCCSINGLIRFDF
jgi:hypothetical protein